MKEQCNLSLKAKKKISLMNIIDSLTSKQLDCESKKVIRNGIMPKNDDVSGVVPGNKTEKVSELHSLNSANLWNTDALSPHFMKVQDASCGTTHSKKFEDAQADPPSLEMQSQGLNNQKSPIIHLIECLANGTDRVKNILKYEIDLIYECKRCRGLFRGLPNLIRHKKDYCRDVGRWSSFINRPYNSTHLEDVSFQEILDTLHPTMQSDFTVELNHLSNSSGAVSQVLLSNKFEKPLDSDEMKREEINCDMGQASTSVNTLRKPLNFSVACVPQRIQDHVKGKNQSSCNLSSASTKTNKAKPTCPLCHKEMAERKNVRRHLVRVHMLSVIDSLKLMHRNRNVYDDFAQKRLFSESSNSLRDKSIGSMVIGNSRKIHILPSSTMFTNTQCPDCKKVLCSKTNLKRHLLEAHDLVVHGGRKYIQLKLLANQRLITGTPTSLRKLQAYKNICDKALANNRTIDIKEEIESPNKGKDINSLAKDSSDATSIQNYSETNSKSDNYKPSVMKLNVKPCQCLLCNKTFSRQSNLKRHMSAFHACDEENFQAAKIENDIKESEATKSVSQMKNSNIIMSKSKEKQMDDAKEENEDTEKVFEPQKKRVKMVEVRIERDPQLNLAFKEKVNKSNCSYPSNKDSGMKTKEEILNRVIANDECIKNEDVAKSSGIGTINRLNNLQTNNVSSESRDHSSLPKISDDQSFLSPRLNNSPSTRKSFIKVTLEKPIFAARKSRTVIGLTHSNCDKKSISNVKRASTVSPAEHGKVEPIFADGCSKMIPGSDSFDIGKCICYKCNTKFDSPIITKRHLVEVHSLSIADALASSYDCLKVNEKVLEAGRELGFDIRLAKCLICNQYYFSRENLSKHMSKIHHLRPKDLEILKHSICKGDAHASQKNFATASDGEVGSCTKSESKQQDCKAVITDDKVSLIQSSILKSPITEIQKPREFYVKKDGLRSISDEGIRMALDVFPKDWINPRTMRCIKCKLKYRKPAALKVHLLKHIGGLGLYACNICKNPNIYVTNVSDDLLKHYRSMHKKVIKCKHRMNYLTESRIDNKQLWEQYGLPVGKW